MAALRETRNKAPEAASKAAHEDVVKQLKALNHDLNELDKKFSRIYGKSRHEMKLGILEAKAQVDSVRALFTGYALAARQTAGSQTKTVETIKEVVKDAQEKTEAILKASPKETAPPPAPRAFKKPKSWDAIQQATKAD